MTIEDWVGPTPLPSLNLPNLWVLGRGSRGLLSKLYYWLLSWPLGPPPYSYMPPYLVKESDDYHTSGVRIKESTIEYWVLNWSLGPLPAWSENFWGSWVGVNGSSIGHWVSTVIHAITFGQGIGWLSHLRLCGRGQMVHYWLLSIDLFPRPLPSLICLTLGVHGRGSRDLL